jgi:hypothetical protein
MQGCCSKGNISSGFIQGAEFHEPKRLLSTQEGLCCMEVTWLVAFSITVKSHSTKFVRVVVHRMTPSVNSITSPVKLVLIVIITYQVYVRCSFRHQTVHNALYLGNTLLQEKLTVCPSSGTITLYWTAKPCRR